MAAFFMPCGSPVLPPNLLILNYLSPVIKKHFMKQFLAALLLTVSALVSFAQTDTFTLYRKSTAMIPMRDGVKLFTCIMSPVGNTKPLPILIARTPYGADWNLKEGGTLDLSLMPS